MQRRSNRLNTSEKAAKPLWEEAMDRLKTPLRAKGVILYGKKLQTKIHYFQHGHFVFTGHGFGPLIWLLRRGFRQRFVILAVEDFAVTLDPLLKPPEA